MRANKYRKYYTAVTFHTFEKYKFNGSLTTVPHETLDINSGLVRIFNHLTMSMLSPAGFADLALFVL